jgi:hypothetical protein
MINKDVDAAVGMSRLWDARKAGREVARQAIKDLKQPPSFFVLFSTIHYKDHGGFEQLLAGVWEVLPEGTPLVGGTVAGFMNNFGCYTHGCTALAVCCEQMDVAVGVGRNTKRNPKRAARQCARMIQSGLQHSKYDNKFLLNFISGPSVLEFLGQGAKKVIDSTWMSKFISLAFGMSQFLFQKGVGREDEIFEEMVKKLPNHFMILGTSFDNYKGLNNFEFFNENVYTNSIVNLGFSTDTDIEVCTTHGMKKTDIHFEITKLSKDRHIIHKINNKPARDELFNLLNWPKGFLNEKTMALTIPYYPISLKIHDREVPIIMPFVLKHSIGTPCIIDEGEVFILRTSGNDLINGIKENLNNFKTINPEFGLCSTCVTVLHTLGYKVEILREQMLKYYGNKPFIAFFCAGEGTYSPNSKLVYANMSFNTFIYGKKTN